MALLEVPQPKRLPPDFVASVSTEGAAAVIALRGEADLATVPVVVDTLARVIADHDGPVVVDLAPTSTSSMRPPSTPSDEPGGSWMLGAAG